MILICRIVGIRRESAEKAVDVLWYADDGSVLRDDGAREIPDQINVPLQASDIDIQVAIEKKREALTDALSRPGVGITLDPEPMLQNDLVGKEF